MNEKTKIIIKNEILKLIEKNPGLHLSRISSLLDIRLSLIEYHLVNLERAKKIVALKEKGYKRYFAIDCFNIEERKILAFLQNKSTVKILHFLLKHPHSSHSSILKNINITKSTLTYHLKRMCIKGIVHEYVHGKNKSYSVVNASKVFDLMSKYNL